jgi:guanylate kinase
VGRIFTLSGPSGVGKTTFLEALHDHATVALIPRHTDRPIRPDERLGFEYHFTSHEGLLHKVFANDFIHFEKWGDYYSAVETALTDNAVRADGDALVLTSVFGAARLRATYGVRVIPLYLWTAGETSLRDPRCLEVDAHEMRELRWRILKKRREDRFSEFESGDLDDGAFVEARMVDNRIDLAAVNGRLRSGESIYVIANKHDEVDRAVGQFLDLQKRLPAVGAGPDLGHSGGCFVLMPFRDDLNPVYDDVIVPVCDELGITVSRADKIFSSRPIVDDIREAVSTASIIIADLTDKNPNVFYEVGMCHALGKTVVLITQEGDVPFDLRHIRHIRYSMTVAGARALHDALKNTLRAALDADTSTVSAA